MIKLANQAKLVLMVCIIQIIFFELVTIFMPIPTSDKMVVFFLVLIALGISAFYVTYSINCMIQGNCNMWAWIIAGVFIASVVFGMLSTTSNVTSLHQILLHNNEEQQKRMIQ